jgi:hypothetical protein
MGFILLVAACAFVAYKISTANDREIASVDMKINRYNYDMSKRKTEQFVEDEKVRRYIESEVDKMYDHFVKVQEWKKQTEGMEMFQAIMHPSFPGSGIIVRNPNMCGYTVYDIETAKYLNVSIHDEINRLYNEKINQYE